METRAAYCSACDRTVRVRVSEDTTEWPPDPAAAAEEGAVCLEHGEACTGEMCPIFGVPPETMKRNLDALDAERGGRS